MGGPGALHWTAAEAADRLRDPLVLDELIDVPALVLDCRGRAAPLPVPLARLPLPVIALAARSTTAQADLVLVDGAPDTLLLGNGAEAAAAALAAAAQRSPAAAAVLVQVLRATAGLPVDEALTVESVAYSLLLTGPDFRTWVDGRRLPRMAEGGEDVAVRRTGALLELALNRPSVHNAYNASVRDGLVSGLALALLDRTVERVVLRGRGPSFCSGGDLRDFGSSPDLVRAHRIRTGRHPGLLMHELGNRLEVHVHGSCVGAGVELPAFGSRVVAARDAQFRLPELSMGTIPGAGGTVSLPRRIGSSRTLLLALSGLSLGAVDAQRWGLVDAVVDELPESSVSV